MTRDHQLVALGPRHLTSTYASPMGSETDKRHMGEPEPGATMEDLATMLVSIVAAGSLVLTVTWLLRGVPGLPWLVGHATLNCAGAASGPLMSERRGVGLPASPVALARAPGDGRRLRNRLPSMEVRLAGEVHDLGQRDLVAFVGGQRPGHRPNISPPRTSRHLPRPPRPRRYVPPGQGGLEMEPEVDCAEHRLTVAGRV